MCLRTVSLPNMFAKRNSWKIYDVTWEFKFIWNGKASGESVEHRVWGNLWGAKDRKVLCAAVHSCMKQSDTTEQFDQEPFPLDGDWWIKSLEILPTDGSIVWGEKTMVQKRTILRS